MLHLEYSLRTEKKTPQHKSTYTINTWLATGETYPALASSHPVQCHLFRRRSQTCSTGGGKKRYRGSWMGEGSNVCSRGREEGRKRVPLHRSLRVVIQTALAKAPVRGARKDTIKLLWLLGRTAANFHSSFSLSILISEITKFHFQSCEFHHDGIHIPVYSLSLIADRSSHSFNQNGQPCETLNSCSRLLNFSITQGKA